MCLLCQDETAYLAYMSYLDEMERQGKTSDPDRTLEAARDASQKAAAAAARRRNDSPFFCDPVDK